MTLAIAPTRRRSARPAASAMVSLPAGTSMVFPLPFEFEGDRAFSHLNLGPEEYMRLTVLSAAAFEAIPQDQRPPHFDRVGDAVVTVGPATRWESPEVCAKHQPSPIECTYDGEQIERTWRPGDTRSCRLCAICTARPDRGKVSCMVCPDDDTFERLVQLERRLDGIPADKDVRPCGLNDDVALELLGLYSENPADSPVADYTDPQIAPIHKCASL